MQQDLTELDLDDIRQRLQDRLWPNRYLHSLGTAETARELACHWQLDETKAYIAGLLHDAAKSWPEEQLLSLSLLYGVPVDDWTLDHPDLLHGPIAAAMLTEEWDIEDEEIEHAIRCHTLPDKEMTPLDTVVYLADKIEPNRRPWNGLEELRELAYKDLDEAMAASLAGCMAYVREKGGEVHPDTQGMLDFYRRRIEQRA
ncbi:MAG: bis(5'-nucleosyl)-tetraphosphatase (symmetrical) YqeK [Firmicutes bacterium]|nr:bis(5'-nucleosyl)-tetraphosphatase (symmetrical) YqeK [Bacillota bacterium]